MRKTVLDVEYSQDNERDKMKMSASFRFPDLVVVSLPRSREGASGSSPSEWNLLA